jgi:hypothetical protein
MHRFKLPKTFSRTEPQQSTPFVPQAFMIVPVVCQVPIESPFMVWQRQMYEQALREAQAVVRPSILERKLLEHWN